MNRPVVLITGASSFLGKSLSKAMEARDLKLVLLSSNREFLERTPSSIPFEIERPLFPDLLPQPTHCVHFAWATDRGKSAQKASYVSGSALARWCAEKNIKALFVSTMAASPDRPTSNYGIYKKLSENDFRKMGHSVVRLGTVVGAQEQGGSAINQLYALPPTARFLLQTLRPITVPITHQDTFNNFVVNQWMASSTSEAYTVIDEVRTLQSLLGINEGKLSLSVLRIGSWFLPRKIGDRLRTLADLRSRVTN